MGPVSDSGFEEADGAAHGRGPLAIAASMAVMFAGATFLALSVADRPSPVERVTITISDAPSATAHEAEVAAARVDISRLPAGAAAAGDRLFSDVSETVEEPASPAISADDDGFTPRLNPARLARPKTGAAAAEPVSDRGMAPRLKPTPEVATQQEAAANAVQEQVVAEAIYQPFAAPDEDGTPPIFFESDLVANRAPPLPVTLAYAADIGDSPRTLTIALEKGETFVDAMRRAGVRADDRNAAAYAFGEHQDLRRLRPGQEFQLTVGEANQTLFQLVAQDHQPRSFLLALDYKPDSENRISLIRDGAEGFAAAKSALEITSRTVAIEGRIGGSLFMSAKQAGAPDKVIADLANIFAYDVDFQREIFGGDEFEAIFDLRYDEDGDMVGSGDVLFARLKWRGRTKEKGYYRFETAESGGRADYFDTAGQSAKRLLMKTPIDGARLSSGFGTRRHPILGYAKAHKGVDFAASRGTPIYAAGDGVVERANRYGSFGNYVKIRHSSGYKTAYAHLNGFARGMRSGKRVRQGEVIGYVGTTGRSTGPHLHYEVHLNGVQVNPMKLKMATGIELKGAELDRFRIVRDRIDAMRRPARANPPLMTAEADDGKQL